MYLYCISNGELCKFGFSAEPLKRLQALQTGSSTVLTLVHTIAVDCEHVRVLERTLHREFANLRVRGEWFRCSAKEGVDYLTWFEIHYVN
mgnify:CR=1 FL=1|jgi:hypothetical protein